MSGKSQLQCLAYEQNAVAYRYSGTLRTQTHTLAGSQPRSLTYIGPSFAVGFTVLSGMGIAPCIARCGTDEMAPGLRLRLEIGASKNSLLRVVLTKLEVL